MPEKIIKNRAYCKKCHEEISSATVHHFNTCRCGALSVDGGTDYLRRVGHPSNYVDTSIVISDAPGGVTDDQLFDLAKAIEDRIECTGGYSRHHGHYMNMKDIVGVLRNQLQALKLL